MVRHGVGLGAVGTSFTVQGRIAIKSSAKNPFLVYNPFMKVAVQVIDAIGCHATGVTSRRRQRSWLLVDTRVIHVFRIPDPLVGSEEIDQGMPPRIGVVACTLLIGIAIRIKIPLSPFTGCAPLSAGAKALA